MGHADSDGRDDVKGMGPGPSGGGGGRRGSSGSSSTGGSSWTVPIGSIFAKEVLKALGDSALRAGTAALQNPAVQKMLAQGTINGAVGAVQSLVVDGVVGGDRGSTLATKMAINAGMNEISGGVSSLVRSPLGSATLSAFINVGLSDALSGSSAATARNAAGEVVSMPVGLAADMMPRGMLIPMLVLKAAVGSFVSEGVDGDLHENTP